MPEFATILAFDVKVDAEAVQMAEENNVRIFSADIIYHLFDQFSAFMNNIVAERRKKAEEIAVWPVVLKILPQHIFNKKDPMIFGVDVVDGAYAFDSPSCHRCSNAIYFRYAQDRNSFMYSLK